MPIAVGVGWSADGAFASVVLAWREGGREGGKEGGGREGGRGQGGREGRDGGGEGGRRGREGRGVGEGGGEGSDGGGRLLMHFLPAQCTPNRFWIFRCKETDRKNNTGECCKILYVDFVQDVVEAFRFKAFRWFFHIQKGFSPAQITANPKITGSATHILVRENAEKRN